MRRMLRPRLEPPRTVSAPAGAVPVPYRPWVEIAARVCVDLPAWGVAERAWVHWALPVRSGAPAADAARRSDPARRAARLGEPDAGEREGDAQLAPDLAAELCAGLAAGFATRIFRCPGLGLTSRPGESRSEFAARCLDAAAPALARGRSAAARRDLASVVGAIEERSLGPGEIRFDGWRAGVAWFPNGIEPATPAAEPLLHAEGGRRR